ncbi:unnamed protein product, partial [Choristocarpus tenellus]
VLQVFCGYHHAFAITYNGEVFSFSTGRMRQLGIDNSDSYAVPQQVSSLCGRRVVLMAGGMNHSLALTSSGEVYSFGSNSSGQLGLGLNTAKEQNPHRVTTLCGLGVTQLACGVGHSVALTGAGMMFQTVLLLIL